MDNNLISSKLVKKLLKKITNFSNKTKCYNFVVKVWVNLKFKKIKPNKLFILILLKLKPLFFFFKKKFRIQKRKKVNRMNSIYLPRLISHSRGLKFALKWFLLPLSLKKRNNFKFIFLLENCFLLFLNNKKKNLALLRKKFNYLRFINYRKYFRY